VFLERPCPASSRNVFRLAPHPKGGQAERPAGAPAQDQEGGHPADRVAGRATTEEQGQDEKHQHDHRVGDQGGYIRDRDPPMGSEGEPDAPHAPGPAEEKGQADKPGTPDEPLDPPGRAVEGSASGSTYRVLDGPTRTDLGAKAPPQKSGAQKQNKKYDQAARNDPLTSTHHRDHR